MSAQPPKTKTINPTHSVLRWCASSYREQMELGHPDTALKYLRLWSTHAANNKLGVDTENVEEYE